MITFAEAQYHWLNTVLPVLAEDQQGGLPWWAWLLIIIVVVLILLLLWWWLKKPSPSGPPPSQRTPPLERTAQPPSSSVEPPQPAVAVPAEPPSFSIETPQPAAAIPAEPVKPDDLKIIEGIGPKIASVLQAAGISTFAQLAQADLGQLEQILKAAELRLADPQTWAEQARLAAEGKWDELQAFQDSLKGGRRV